MGAEGLRCDLQRLCGHVRLLQGQGDFSRHQRDLPVAVVRIMLYLQTGGEWLQADAVGHLRTGCLQSGADLSGQLLWPVSVIGTAELTTERQACTGDRQIAQHGQALLQQRQVGLQADVGTGVGRGLYPPGPELGQQGLLL